MIYLPEEGQLLMSDRLNFLINPPLSDVICGNNHIRFISKELHSMHIIPHYSITFK
jgi:hypothetical protein